MSDSRIVVFFIAIIALSTAMHFPHFSKDLVSVHVWRQTQTQTTINNFYEEDMNILNPRKNDRGAGDGIFRMEFPLMQYLVAVLYKVFGKHLIITRLFMFFVGILSMFGIYQLIQTIFKNQHLALLTSFAFCFSPSFYYYTINPLPDNFALCCAIWGMVFFFKSIEKETFPNLLLTSLLLGIATLCKLPFILYFIVPTTQLAIDFFSKRAKKQLFLKGTMLFLGTLLGASWYIWVVSSWQNGIVKGVLDNQESWQTILKYISSNLFSTLPELLLNYIAVPFFLLAFYFFVKNKAFQNKYFPLFLAWALSLIAYTLFEINMIASVHDYYLFPFYPILFIVLAYGFHKSLQNEILRKTMWVLCLLPLTCYLRMATRWNTENPNFNKNLLIFKEDLQKAVPKDALCVIGSDQSHFIYCYYLDKKGWVFDHDKLSASQMNEMVNKGASFLYSDSRIIDESPDIQPFIDRVILERGDIRVFSLKKN